ncbi:MAG: hypothetical protein AABZ12_11975 [Planctomycetota bacterium]
MFKKVLGAGLGAVLMIAAVGCDEETLAKIAPGAAKMLQAGSSYGLGDAVMDQVRLQDQLRDGTGTNCSNPDGSGTCDGTGPYGSGGGTGGGGAGSGGNGGGDRLRDGSCGG